METWIPLSPCLLVLAARLRRAGLRGAKNRARRESGERGRNNGRKETIVQKDISFYFVRTPDPLETAAAPARRFLSPLTHT